jgi:hypothetical protein
MALVVRLLLFRLTNYRKSYDSKDHTVGIEVQKTKEETTTY